MAGWFDTSLNTGMNQLTASNPSPSPDPNALPSELQPPGYASDPSSGQVDWSWLTQGGQGSGPTQRGYPTAENYGPALQAISNLFSGMFAPASPEDQLFGQILIKMGGGSSGKFDTAGAKRVMAARYAAHLAMQSSTARAAAAKYLGWNTENSHVQYWVQNSGGIPDNPTDKGPVAPKDSTAAAPAAAVDSAGSKVQFPFPYSEFSNSNYNGNNYGDRRPDGVYWGGWQWHQGQDYGVAQGTPLYFPFAGKVVKAGYDPKGYGNYVTVQFGDQGLTMTYAHLSYSKVKQGEAVTPGQLVALSGGDGPGSGISTGAHLLVVEQDANGHPIDPRPLLSSLYNNGTGTTLGALQNQGVGSTGVPITPGTNAQYETTPDGHVLWEGTPDRAYYDMVATVYAHYYGTQPPYSIVMGMKSAGVTNVDQMAAVASNWPSDIPGVSFGTRENIYNTANGIAMKNYGRPIPDSLVKQLATQGKTSVNDIKEWFDTHVPTDMPAAEYQQVYDAAMPNIQTTYGQGPSPEYVGYLWGQAQTQQQGTVTTPPASLTTQGGQAAPPAASTGSPAVTPG
jgi:murein DD-endopeptidase MepM/ murein hydrolase activator NlpD